MIDDEALADLGPALLSLSGRALLAQMRAFTDLGDRRRGVSVSTPAFGFLIKQDPAHLRGGPREASGPASPPDSSAFIHPTFSEDLVGFRPLTISIVGKRLHAELLTTVNMRSASVKVRRNSRPGRCLMESDKRNPPSFPVSAVLLAAKQLFPEALAAFHIRR